MNLKRVLHEGLLKPMNQKGFLMRNLTNQIRGLFGSAFLSILNRVLKTLIIKPTPNTYSWSAVRQRAMVRLPPPGLKLSGIDGWEREEAGSDGGDDPTATATPDLVRNFLLVQKSVAQNATTDPSKALSIGNLAQLLVFLGFFFFFGLRFLCIMVLNVGFSSCVQILADEVILTLGSSRTVLEFLCAAKEKKRSFRVFVAEGAPRYQGHLLAKELVSRGLQTTLITDSAVFAMISRVNMVIVGAHAVMANGSVIAPVGLNMVALAAQRHAVPFVVLADSHKLCPLYPHNPEVLLNELRSPSELLDFGEFSDCMDFKNGAVSPLLHVVNPTFDYVPPKLVSLFITDTGGYNPSYMYRLIADYYSADDLVVQRRTATGS
ncbi:hypothetical protein UlMin_022811 [Ulmus minor]